MPTFPAGSNSLDGMPTRNQMTCLYLYDSLEPPAPGTLKTKDDVMKYKTGKREPLIIDANWFMTKGGGRFVDVGSFAMVRKFLSKEDGGRPLPTPPEGTSDTYNPISLAEKYGKITSKNPLLALKQYDYGIDDPDFIHRAEVFGSSAFKLNPETEFVINDTGFREIRNVFVMPEEDNYDFESSSDKARVHNGIMKDIVDPWNIATQVKIEFEGTIEPRVINEDQWKEVERKYNALQAKEKELSAVKALSLLDEKIEDLRRNKILYWRYLIDTKPMIIAATPPTAAFKMLKFSRDHKFW